MRRAGISGDVGHASVGLRGGLSMQLTPALEADFPQISTTGSLRLVDTTIVPINLQWTNGVKVWSSRTASR